MSLLEDRDEVAFPTIKLIFERRRGTIPLDVQKASRRQKEKPKWLKIRDIEVNNAGLDTHGSAGLLPLRAFLPTK